MAAFEVTLETRVLDRLIQSLVPRTRQATERAAYRIEGRAKANAPVKTGRLRASIHAMRDPGAQESWLVGTDVAYARYVEFGTTRMAPRPYLIPAFEAERARFSDVIGEIFR